MPRANRARGAALALGVTIILAGCGTTSSHRLPNPFTVVHRWSAASLGLMRNVDDPGDASLAIGPDGNLYTTDRSQRVWVISPDGRVLRWWGGRGTGPGKFHFVTTDLPNAINGKIAVGSNGLVYVSDNGNARIQEFKLEGRHARFVGEFGSFGDGPSQFRLNADLAVDDAGNVYVTELNKKETVSAFSAAGHFLWSRGGHSTETKPDIGHLFLGGFDAHGKLVTLEDNAGLVVYLDQHGREYDAFATYPSPSYASGISVDGLGNVYLTSGGAGLAAAIDVFDHSHHLVGQWQGSDDLLAIAPRFGPHGEVFALGWDGSLLKLKITLPGS